MELILPLVLNVGSDEQPVSNPGHSASSRLLLAEVNRLVLGFGLGEAADGWRIAGTSSVGDLPRLLWDLQVDWSFLDIFVVGPHVRMVSLRLEPFLGLLHILVELPLYGDIERLIVSLPGCEGSHWGV